MSFEIDREEWTIKDDSSAEWALQHIAEDKSEYERLETLGKERIEYYTEKIEAARKRFENSTAYFNGKLMEYFQTVRHKKTKSGIEKYALLSGTLQMKPASKKPVVNDEQLVEWLAASGMTDYIKTKKTPAWGDLKKLLDFSGDVPVVKETGEVVEGVTFEDIPETFEIKFAKKGDDENGIV